MSYEWNFREKRVYGKVEVLRLTMLANIENNRHRLLLLLPLSLTRELRSKIFIVLSRTQTEIVSIKFSCYIQFRKPHGHEARLRQALILDDVDGLFLLSRIAH